MGGGAGIGNIIGSQIGGFGAGLTQAINKFGDLVETPQANAADGYRTDPTETRNYNEYVNYQPQSIPQSETSYGETGSSTPAFIFPDSPAKITPPPVIQYGEPLPPSAGDLEYVVNTNFPNARKATASEKSYLQSFGIGL